MPKAESSGRPRKVLTTEEARQASPRKMNLRVLLFSTLVAAVALGALYIYFLR